MSKEFPLGADFTYGGAWSRNNLLAFLGYSRRPEADYFCSPHPIGNTGMRVYLKRGVHGKDRRGKSSRHRLIVICTCGQHVPAGRMGQHRHSHRHYEQEASK